MMTKRLLHHALRRFGYGVKLYRTGTGGYPADFGRDEVEIIEAVRPFTMTSPELIAALVVAVKYVVENEIAGDFVECGVWRGGSVMAALHALMKFGDTERTIHLFDTFSGMTNPGEADVSFAGERAADLLGGTERRPAQNMWCWATLDDVKRNVLATRYPAEKVRFVEGDVLETIPTAAPERIALLRLDTDWYESTKHELIHLYPRLARGGVLIIDDYGYWRGARQAVDEYFAAQKYKPLLHRADHTGRCLVKL